MHTNSPANKIDLQEDWDNHRKREAQSMKMKTDDKTPAKEN